METYADEKRLMHRISAYAGRPDYVQGGGGNTSVKFNGGLMAIKASGYTLGEITEDKGYVTVDYGMIRAYYDSVDKNGGRDFEKESLEVNLKSISLLPGMEEKRPSVEVGFHSFLRKIVIHTHSVYANVLCCSAEGRDAAGEILQGSGIRHMFLPYIDPGFSLTLAIKEAAEDFERRNGAAPDAIFLGSHGVIVHSGDAGEAMEIHETINARVRAHFGLEAFPDPAVKQKGNAFCGDTPFLKEFIIKNGAGEDYFKALRLYPDLLVYTAGRLGNVIRIGPVTGEVVYRCGGKEAQTIEETLAGAAFVIDSIRAAGLTLRQMDEAGALFINNWESEKYRAGLMK